MNIPNELIQEVLDALFFSCLELGWQRDALSNDGVVTLMSMRMNEDWDDIKVSQVLIKLREFCKNNTKGD